MEEAVTNSVSITIIDIRCSTCVDRMCTDLWNRLLQLLTSSLQPVYSVDKMRDCGTGCW